MTDTDQDPVAAAYQTIRAQKPWRHPSSTLIHHRVVPNATLAPWLNDAEFLAVYDKIKTHTLVDVYRCHELWTLAKQAAAIDGDILEVGVWRGGSGAILARAAAAGGKRVYLADTFVGVVKAGDQDTKSKGGEHADTSIVMVAELMASLGIENVELLMGVFPDDTQQRIGGKIAMLHCDVDVYSSAKDIVDWCLPRLAAGAMLVFDDYGFFGCDGVTRFCDEFRARPDFRFIHNLNGHAIFIKVA